MKLSKLKHRATISGLILIAVYGILLVSVQIHERIIRSRSESLYKDFLSLQLGVNTKPDIDILRHRWENRMPEEMLCNGDDCDYIIGDQWGLSRWFMLTQFARDHAPASSLTLRIRNNLLSKASFSARVFVPKGYGTREERKLLKDPGYVPYSSGEYMLFGRAELDSTFPEYFSVESSPTFASGYRVWGPSGCMNCIATFITALSSVKPETRAKLFRFNFSCMTQWSVCTDKEDIMPMASETKIINSATD